MFYTPLNDPDDGGISGDRLMARQIRQVLQELGHELETLVTPRSYSREPQALDGLKEQASQQLAAMAREWDTAGSAPDLWFTYHPYYRAPDLLGPAVTEQLGIPYVTAEASESARRAKDGWAQAAHINRAALRSASLHFCMTRRDREGLGGLVDEARLMALPPFLTILPDVQHTKPSPVPRLLVVAMMRGGVKLESYQLLARSLEQVLHLRWTLTIAGDGPARSEVEAAFARLDPERLRWLGQVSPVEAASLYASHDLFVWPGLGEAYGLVYLEAQGAGLPVIACDSGGVSDVMLAGQTGILVPERDTTAYAAALVQLLANPSQRRIMGLAGQDFVLKHRSLAPASAIMRAGLDRAFQNARKGKQDTS